MTTPLAPAPSRLAQLTPAWGAALMGLSGGTLVSLRDPLPASLVDQFIGLGLLVIAAAAAVTLTVLSVARLVRHRAAFLADLANPGIGAMIASWPAGVMILALAVLQGGVSGALPREIALVVGMIVFVPGILGTLVTGYAFYTRIIGLAEVPHAAVTAGWFVPVVPLVLVPSILVRALELGLPGDGDLWAFLGVIAWGVGFSLFLLLASIIGSRLLVAAPPAAHQAPSWWTWLAPLGAGGAGLLASARLGERAGIISSAAEVAALPATVLWGFSVWWMLLAVRVILRERGRLTFHVGWWGFGFPTAAFTTLTAEVARLWGFTWLAPVITALWVALLLILSALTIASVRLLRAAA